LGGILGLITALVLVYLIFEIGININLKSFFYFSSILLIFVASGLAGYGVHELIVVYEPSGWMGMNAFEISISEGHILHDDSILGSILSVMFGYSTKMEWLRVIVQFGYLAISLPSVILLYKMPQKLTRIKNSLLAMMK
ncbi:MAG: FTR1 family protein, partial [Candidatus Thermoplasmatota archaeon]